MRHVESLAGGGGFVLKPLIRPVELLLERGADPELAGAPWATPLAWARKKGHADVATALRAHGAGSD